MLHEIRLLMDKNKYLRGLVPIIQETRFMQYKGQFIHSRDYDSNSLKLAENTREEFRTCYEAHRSEFEALSEMLEDDFSRLTLRTVIEYRLSPCKKTLRPVIVGPQYFPRDILRPVENELFIDGGGYTGDTIIALAAFWGKNKWKKVYSWEPDEINRNKLIETCKIHGFENVEIVPYGLWSEKTELHFNMQGKDWSRVSPDSANIVTVDSIDHLCSEERITYIKMDIERSELQALRGAQNVIRRDRPRLAISIYHKPEDYYEIPFYVKSLVPEYKLYIRHHKSSKNDTVLYAVCP